MATASRGDTPTTCARAWFTIVATHPEELLLDQWDLEPRLAEQVLDDIVDARRNPTVTRQDVLGQLHRGGAPRFAAHVG